MSVANPLHILASALGLEPSTPSTCAICGPSIFAAAGPRTRVLKRGFTDHSALRDPRASTVCQGCERLLSGRPGDDPPPLRTVSVEATTDQLRVLDRSDWWDLLTGLEPIPAAGCVLSWALSRRRHHWLHAGVSTASSWQVGSDDGRISWTPDPDLPEAIVSLRSVGASKGAILSGRYPVRLIAEHTERVARAETVLSACRGQLILDLAVWAAPPIEAPSQPVEAPMIDPRDKQAADLLAVLAWGSEMRATDGIQFWGGYLLRRIRRFARLPLPSCISRLISECRVSIQDAAELAARIDALDTETCRAIEAAMQERPDLIHALAFARVQEIRVERKQSKRAAAPTAVTPKSQMEAF